MCIILPTCTAGSAKARSGVVGKLVTAVACRAQVNTDFQWVLTSIPNEAAMAKLQVIAAVPCSRALPKRKTPQHYFEEWKEYKGASHT